MQEKSYHQRLLLLLKMKLSLIHKRNSKFQFNTSFHNIYTGQNSDSQTFQIILHGGPQQRTFSYQGGGVNVSYDK